MVCSTDTIYRYVNTFSDKNASKVLYSPSIDWKLNTDGTLNRKFLTQTHSKYLKEKLFKIK